MNFVFLILRQCPPRKFVRGFLQGHGVGVGILVGRSMVNVGVGKLVESSLVDVASTLVGRSLVDVMSMLVGCSLVDVLSTLVGRSLVEVVSKLVGSSLVDVVSKLVGRSLVEVVSKLVGSSLVEVVGMLVESSGSLVEGGISSSISPSITSICNPSISLGSRRSSGTSSCGSFFLTHITRLSWSVCLPPTVLKFTSTAVTSGDQRASQHGGAASQLGVHKCHHDMRSHLH